VELERAHGSVLLGLARRKGPPRRIVGFDGGMARLTKAMAAALPTESLRLGAETTRLARGPSGWDVAWREADGSERGARCRHLIVTAPPWAWACLPFDHPPARLLAEAERVAAPPVTLVVRGYDRRQVAHPLNGFGLLAPRREGRKVLGVLFPSSVFPSCAPEGKVMLSCFLGGTRSPELGLLDDAALSATVDRELGELLGARGAPERQWVARWRRSIPQYHSGHAALLAALAATEAAEPGLAFVGGFRGGVSLMSTVRRGRALGSALTVG
jgi:oxygen-dependent protoporphyrinogen oxidase